MKKILSIKGYRFYIKSKKALSLGEIDSSMDLINKSFSLMPNNYMILYQKGVLHYIKKE